MLSVYGFFILNIVIIKPPSIITPIFNLITGLKNGTSKWSCSGTLKSYRMPLKVECFKVPWNNYLPWLPNMKSSFPFDLMPSLLDSELLRSFGVFVWLKSSVSDKPFTTCKRNRITISPVKFMQFLNFCCIDSTMDWQCLLAFFQNFHFFS